jgi:hypothetical protein
VLEVESRQKGEGLTFDSGAEGFPSAPWKARSVVEWTSLQDSRGGGTGGLLLQPDSETGIAVKDQEQRGAWSVQRSAEASRYILAASSCAPSLFSVCFFLAILRQRSQGCFPSNVLLIPTSTPSASEYLTSIPNQAVACKTAQ